MKGIHLNIKIPHNWLKDFVKTSAKPQKIAELLSLHSFSVEEIHNAEESDAVYEIEITPNRPDAMSVVGIARELAVILRQNGIKAEFKDATTEIALITDKEEQPPNPLELNVKIKNPNLVPRFTAVVLRNTKVGESPQYIKDRLQKVGIRPLNNVIDITNYLMVERGQPMHVFDYDKIHNANMILREANKGETVTTLDGQIRKLPQGAIIIDDGKKLIDLCGIMGGENTKVDAKTNKVVLFVQIYDPLTIRRTVQALGFRTEAATRFEKGMDPRGVIPALNQAANFLTKEAKGEIGSKLIDIENKKYKPHSVDLEAAKVKKVLGVEIPEQDSHNILNGLGFRKYGHSELDSESKGRNSNLDPDFRQDDKGDHQDDKGDHQDNKGGRQDGSGDNDSTVWEIPSWRHEDIQIPEDLIEEVARIYGYHNLPINLPPLPKELPQEADIFDWENKIKQTLKGWGYAEVYNYSFTNTETLEKTNIDPAEALEIENPLTTDLTHLRPNLLPQMLKVVEENAARFDKQTLFQLSRVFTNKAKEKRQLVLTLYSNRKNAEELFFQIKGTVEALAKELNIKELEFAVNTEENNQWQPNAGASIIVEGEKIGELGIVKENTAAAVVDSTKLINKAEKIKAYTPPLQHPPIIEDLTLVADEQTPVGNLKKTIESLTEYQDSRITVTAQFSKIYRDKELQKNSKKAVTFNLHYRSPEKTLSDTEVKEVRKAILEKLKENHGAELRR